MVSSTSAEISVIRKPQGTLRTQDVLLEEEEDEEERDDHRDFCRGRRHHHAILIAIGCQQEWCSPSFFYSLKNT